MATQSGSSTLLMPTVSNPNHSSFHFHIRFFRSRPCSFFSLQVEYIERRREDREEALKYMTEEEADEFDEVPNLDKAIKEIDDYHRRINLPDTLANRKFHIKPNQLVRVARSHSNTKSLVFKRRNLEYFFL